MPAFDTLPLDGPALPPASGGPPRHLVVLLHGYGADGHDLIGLAPHLAPALPHALFVAPNAPEPCEMAPFGRQWFSLARYDPEMARRDPATLATALDALDAGAAAAQPRLDAFLDALLEAQALTADRLALVGFSQGTMMALRCALRRPRAVATVVGFSGALTGAATLADAVTARPPITLIHGEDDPVVPFPAMALAEAGLRAAGLAVTTHGCPGLEHGIDPQGLAVARDALTRALAP
ncbi:alpha/beta hydrolase [Roseospira visakhapatnamensis]|uniref:Phospholipase/carboxylesterase n=1 Tax=Roseospira visakhapatnamensis TaxID=390880 RepID=A0A7W6W941_9PROT|nr:alpha/beta fold hydrolase [Roseospira visakhapatnamensis]MBB4265700.1 phospholipase/carboxylesterase [Roseospira visakhapatnamensis]